MSRQMRGRPTLGEKNTRILKWLSFYSLSLQNTILRGRIIWQMFYFLIEDFTKCVVFRIFLILVIE